jgi:hypothetical protein
LPVLQAAAEVFEASWWRGGLGSERSLVVSSPYGLLAVAQLRAGQPDRAFASLQAHHGRTVRAATRLLALPAGRPRPAGRPGVGAWKHCEARLGRLEAADYEAMLSAPAIATRTASLRQDLAQARLAQARAEADWSDFQADLRRRQRTDDRGQIAVPQLAAALAPQERLLGWLDEEVEPGGHESWSWLVTPGGGVRWRPLAAGEPAVDFAQIWAAGEEPDASRLTAFSSARLAILAAEWPAMRRLFVVPSGELAGFPLGLLTTPDGASLVERCDVSCLTAPGQLVGRRPATAGASGPTDLLVVADPPFSVAHGREIASAAMPAAGVLRSALAGNRGAIASLPRLAGSRREAAAIATMFPAATSYLGPEASEANLAMLAREDRLRGYDVIHLATHAIIDAEQPGESALVLAQTAEALQGDDGLLCAREIERQWRLDAELVTLSACESGLGRRVDGEGYLGFAQVLLGAGARHVLASLWPVDDQATTLLMERFYAGLTGAGGAAPSGARRRPCATRRSGCAGTPRRRGPGRSRRPGTGAASRSSAAVEILP